MPAQGCGPWGGETAPSASKRATATTHTLAASVSAASTRPARGKRRSPHAASAAPGGRTHVSSWPGNTAPAIVGARNVANATVAPQIATRSRGHLDVDLVGERDRQPLATRAQEQPHRDEGQRGEGAQRSRPTSRSIHSPSRRGARARCAPTPLAPVGARVGQQRGGERPAVEAVVDRDVQDEREEHDLERDEAREAAAGGAAASGRSRAR